jgi:hypothetical protein
MPNAEAIPLSLTYHPCETMARAQVYCIVYLFNLGGVYIIYKVIPSFVIATAISYQF